MIPHAGLAGRRHAALFVLLALASCDDDGAAPDPPVVDAGAPHPDAEEPVVPPPPTEKCPSVPTAYVFDHADPWTRVQGAADLLAAAGFAVQPLPLDRSPAELTGMIFFASFASESPEYRQYVGAHAAGLQAFVGRGNVLVQMTQADQTEATPPFLPPSLRAIRHDVDVGRLYALDLDHELLRGARIHTASGSWATERYLVWQGPTIGWETFSLQRGFEIVLADGPHARNPVLLEGEHGAGRILLAATALDKPTTPGAERDAFARSFFRNLVRHTGDVCRQAAPPLRVMPTHQEPIAPDAWVLGVLPDTQYYVKYWPQLFDQQTAWIRQNAARLNMKYVVHLGDLTEDNVPRQWELAARSMAMLDGVVPYAIVGGNHDYGPMGFATTRDTLMNDYFPYDRTARLSTFGGAFEPGKLDNTYHLFSAGGRDWIIVALEWGPRDEAVAWANDVMKAHPDRRGIFVTHAFTNWNDRRLDFARDPQDIYHHNPHIYGTPGTVNDGEELWQKLIRKHRFDIVLSGHVLADGTGFVVSLTDVGNRCYQMMYNYQMRDMGGGAYLRLLEFAADRRTVQILSYSPRDGAYYWDRDQYYTITLD